MHKQGYVIIVGVRIYICDCIYNNHTAILYTV